MCVFYIMQLVSKSHSNVFVKYEKVFAENIGVL